MKLTAITALALLGIAAATAAQDDWKREGNPQQRKQKDPLEGKAPPELQVRDWLNTDGKALTLAGLRGKVVLLDFWGVW